MKRRICPSETTPHQLRLGWSSVSRAKKSAEERRNLSTRMLLSKVNSSSRPRARSPDDRETIQVFAETPIDIFEALPEELDVIPDDLYVVRSPRVSVPEDPRQRIAPTKRTSSASQGAEERDPQWRRQRYESKGQTRDRGAHGTIR